MEQTESASSARLSVPQAVTVLIAVMLLVDALPMAFTGVALTMRADHGAHFTART